MTQPDRLDRPTRTERPDPPVQPGRMDRVRGSMLWSAWADALGFISELTSEAGLRRRTNGRPLTDTMSWSRRVGGRHGPEVDLPAGCYSDDTQLRLAAGRAVSTNGFDVEAFARVELPVWLCYALGGGRATKAAAVGMARQQVGWAANFYPGWTDAGGNGAAMRVQPHVYAAADLDSHDYLQDVVRDAVVTHGHPRALVGAVLHAAALGLTLHRGRVPPTEEWPDLLEVTRGAVALFDDRTDLSLYWKPRWEQDSRQHFGAAWQSTIAEVEAQLDATRPALDRLRAAGDDPEAAQSAYGAIVTELKLDDEHTRGSGTATVVAGLLLAAAYPDDPARSARLAAGRLDTDTDTIATMAAAVVGAAAPLALPSIVQDEAYLLAEADRYTQVAVGEPSNLFAYPDLLRWQPPRSGLDSVGLADEKFALAGLGWLTPQGPARPARDGLWQWTTTSFGPTLLVKHRNALRPLPPGNWPGARSSRPDPSGSKAAPPTLDEANWQPTLLGREQPKDQPALVPPPAIDLAQIAQWLSRNNYDDASVGRAFRRVTESGTDAQFDDFIRLVTTELRRRADQRTADLPGPIRSTHRRR